MASLKDLGKLVNGVSLVAKEAMRRGIDKPDLQSLIRRAILSATDISGLTKGEVRNFVITGNKPIGDTDGIKQDSSVVYFGEEVASSSDTTSDPNTPKEAQRHFPSPTPTPTLIYDNGNLHADARINHPKNAKWEGDVESGSLQTMIITPPPATLDNNAAAIGVGEGKAVPLTNSPPPKAPPLINKQRRRKERRVPSTPFSRALG